MDQAIKQAVIFAGGRGVRLRPLTFTVPKPMVKVAGRPFLEHLIELLRGNGITDVLLLLGYLPEKITEHFGDGKKFGVRIRYSITDADDDTGTRLRKAAALLDDTFLLMYGDNYLPVELKKMVAFHNAKGTTGMVTVYNNRDGGGEYGRKNNVKVEDGGMVSYYGPASDDPAIANATDVGFFIMPKDVVRMLPEENCSFQVVVLPNLIKARELMAYRTDHPYYPITSLAHLPIVQRFLEPKKVIFLDRDGVINKKPADHDYVKRWGEFEFVPGAAEAVKLLTDAGYEIYVISNQRGIARGLMSSEDLLDVNRRMAEELARSGGRIAGVYHCPHGKDENCFCRKPNPGMLFQAAREHHINLTKAVMVGDSASDEAAGIAAGCRTILAKEGDLLNVVQSLIRES